ncbi:MAG: magnesium transporter CorA family protein [Patescibacteria group bacterium]
MPTRLNTRQSLEHGNYEWIHLTRNQPQDIDYLKRKFSFHPTDLRDTLPPLQRHKLVIRDEYLFMILLFPIFNRKTRIVTSAELDFFILPQRLITINDGSLPVVESLFAEIRKDKKRKAGIFEDGVTGLVHEIINAQFDELFPMLVHVSSDIDEVEKDLFKSDQSSTIIEVLRIKTNIVNIRKAMQGHKRVIRELINKGVKKVPVIRKAGFEDLIERSKEFWDTVELQRDTINALHETHSSLIENRTNDIIKTLTMFSVIIFPMTLVATLFAMDVGGMPFKNEPYGFFLVLFFLALVAFGMFAFFKKRRWI